MAKQPPAVTKIIDGAQAVDRCFRRVASCQLDDRRIAPAVGLPRRSANSECMRLLGRDVGRGHRRGIDKAARNEAGGRGRPVGRRRHRQNPLLREPAAGIVPGVARHTPLRPRCSNSGRLTAFTGFEKIKRDRCSPHVHDSCRVCLSRSVEFGLRLNSCQLDQSSHVRA